MNELQPVFYSVEEKVSLVEVLKRIHHFVKPNGPILPTLVLFGVLNLLSFHQIISPGLTDKNGIASQSFNEFLIIDQDITILTLYLVLIPIAAFTIYRKSPPIIVAIMKAIVVFLLLPFLELFVLLEAELFQHFPLWFIHLRLIQNTSINIKCLA